MSSIMNQRIWVAVRVQRGFISDVCAYCDEKSAGRCERSWRHRMNADYDEIVVSAAHVKAKSNQMPTSAEPKSPKKRQ